MLAARRYLSRDDRKEFRDLLSRRKAVLQKVVDALETASSG